MSIGTFGFAEIGAATPLPQSRGSDADRAVQESNAQRGKLQSDLKAELAAGVGQTDGDEHEIEDREGDGRMPWQTPDSQQTPQQTAGQPGDAPLPCSRDASGLRGNVLDLTG